MRNKSNDYGRAYEFAYLIELYKEISKLKPVEIVKNSSHNAAERAWNMLSKEDKTLYETSAKVGVKTILDLEPLICDNREELVQLKIQTDSAGEKGDVRDLLIIQRSKNWEIGLSIKHNNFAVKHSRLSKNLDFGKKWYGEECSKEYWEEVKPIFDFLDEEKRKGTRWSEIADKADVVYVPILNAFKKELERQNEIWGKKIPERMIKYLLGEFDFYKVVGIDGKKTTQIQCYNLRGTLNKQGKSTGRKEELPMVKLPTKIFSLEYKANSKNTLRLYLDEGWQFSFRIHNAATKVEASLKFDIQIIDMPATVVSINSQWK